MQYLYNWTTYELEEKYSINLSYYGNMSHLFKQLYCMYYASLHSLNQPSDNGWDICAYL